MLQAKGTTGRARRRQENGGEGDIGAEAQRRSSKPRGEMAAVFAAGVTEPVVAIAALTDISHLRRGARRLGEISAAVADAASNSRETCSRPVL